MMKNRVLSIALAAVIGFAGTPMARQLGGGESPLAVSAAENACGDDMTWTLSNDGTLTIGGTGEMYDWHITSVSLSSDGGFDVSFDGEATPWLDYSAGIKK